MKNLIICALFFVFSTSINAEEFRVFVESFDEDLDASELESKEISVKKQAQPVVSQTSDLPSPREMRAIFKEVGFGPEIMSLDQMDKDLFYLKVQQRDMSYLKKKYPDVSVEKIKKLKKLISDTK
jgi:hypothetical protein